MTIKLPLDISKVKGFLADDEAQALYDAALETSAMGPCLEIGSYCGKSTIYFGLACKQNNAVLYALDHHRGSEEHQKGEMFHDPDLFDGQAELMDSFKDFRTNMRASDLEDTVIPVVSSSAVASKQWGTALAMVFIDGGHSLDAALCDYRSWACHIKPGGILAIHDIFPNAEDGGQAPYEIYKLALASGLFEKLSRVNSLGLLRRIQ